MNINLTKKVTVFNYCKPYVIAELGSNHNGDMDLAKKMIKAAAQCGANCVKFQSWSTDSIFCKKKYEDNYFMKDDYRDRSDFTLEEIVEKFSISQDQLVEMKKYADKVGVDFTSTPFSNDEADFLVDKLKAPFIKVASMDLNNYPFLEYLGNKNIPIVLSTGLSELYEIDKAIKTIENTGNKNIIILHCVAMYPPDDKDINLNNIETLQKLYPYPIGFSDHSLGFSIPLAAVAKGACIIEKHFTLDKNMFGWDHKVSATPDEMEVIVKESLRINNALGSDKIRCVEDDFRKQEFKRSIVTSQNIIKGEVFTTDSLTFKRPGTGIPPEYVKFVIGKTAKKDIECDQLLSMEDF